MSAVWDYKEYDLQKYANKAKAQKPLLRPIVCEVLDNGKNKQCQLTQAEANTWNKKLHSLCTGIGPYIEKYLITRRLTQDKSRLQPHEIAVGTMVYSGVQDSNRKTLFNLLWKAKITQLFIEKCEDNPNADNCLREVLHSLSITNPTNPNTGDNIILSGTEAYLLKLTISHTNHLNGKIVDCNPKNFHGENHPSNISKKSCGKYFFMRLVCQCAKKCGNRSAWLLKQEFLEHHVRTQLLMAFGFWPSYSEEKIREEIRKAFIAYLEHNDQEIPSYLSEDNKSNLLKSQHQDIANIRGGMRFDMNAPGKGIYCTRQKCYVTFMDIFSGDKDIPVGLLEELEEQMPALRPVAAQVDDEDNDVVEEDEEDEEEDYEEEEEGEGENEVAQRDRFLPGTRMSQEKVDEENLHNMQRVLAMKHTLEMLARCDFTNQHRASSMQERAVNSIHHIGTLYDNVQSIDFRSSGGDFTNDYLKRMKKNVFNVTVPRLLKTLQLFIDHHEVWRKLRKDNDGDDWLESSDEDDNDEDDEEEEDVPMLVPRDDEDEEGGDDDEEDEDRSYARMQDFLGFISIQSASGVALQPHEAYVQVLHASHMTHPAMPRHVNPLQPQLCGEVRDGNPDNTKLEEADLNLHRGVCSLRPSIPCMGQCTCHPVHKCAPNLSKLGEREIQEETIVHSQLGINGRYPGKDMVFIRGELAKETRDAFIAQNKTVPPFISGYLENQGTFFEYKCPHPRCNETYMRYDQCAQCIEQHQQQEQQQQQPPDGDTRAVVANLASFLRNETYKNEYLTLIKYWGWGRVAIIEKKLSFKFEKSSSCYDFRNKAKFIKYCEEEKDVDYATLKQCNGMRFGCPCNLHEECSENESESESESDDNDEDSDDEASNE